MKRSVLLAALLCAGVLAGCGKQEGSADSLAGLVKDSGALAKLKDWCNANAYRILSTGDQAGYDKCNLADTATWFVKNPDMLALVKKPEPWPGKTTAFFQSAMQANSDALMLPSQEQTDLNFKIDPAKDAVLKKYHAQIAAVPSSAIHAWQEESAWCEAQFTWKTGHRPKDGATFDQISPACDAASKVKIGGAF
jgi:pectin methylesterase-like acyl-CoA thioesterase